MNTSIRILFYYNPNLKNAHFVDKIPTSENPIQSIIFLRKNVNAFYYLMLNVLVASISNR